MLLMPKVVQDTSVCLGADLNHRHVASMLEIIHGLPGLPLYVEMAECLAAGLLVDGRRRWVNRQFVSAHVLRVSILGYFHSLMITYTTKNLNKIN